MKQTCITVVGLLIILTGCHRFGPSDTISVPGDTAGINSTIRYATTILQKKPDSALCILNQTLQKSIRAEYINGIGDSYEFMGVAFFYKFNYDTAIYLQNKAYDYYRESGNKNRMALVLFSLSYDYSVLQDLEKSLVFAEKSKELYAEIKNYPKVYDCLEALAYLHNQLHHSKAVDSLMQEMVITAEKIGDKKKMANSYYNLGNHYIDQAYLNLAIEAFYKALKLSEQSGDSVEIANATGSVGLAHLYLQEYDKAIEYYLRQEKILSHQNNQYELSITYTNLGEAYNALNNYSIGLNYHLKALSVREQMNFKPALSNSLHNVANTYYLLNDSIDKAFTCTERSMRIDREINNEKGLAKTFLLLGKLQLLKNNYSPGIENLERSYSIAQKYEEPVILQEASGALSKAYSKTGNYKRAFDYLVINRRINDSIVSGKNIKRITQLELQHVYDKKSNILELNHLSEKLEFETRLKRKRTELGFSLILGFIIIISAFFVYKSYLRSRKADKVKESLLKEIHHRVKNNLMVISSLLNLQSGHITDDQTRSAVKESQSRVKSMALIHQLLYQTEEFTRIDFPKYLEQLLASLQGAYIRPGSKIQYRVYAEDIHIDIDTAIPLGLITNELATNAYKYAFEDRDSGEIDVVFKKVSVTKCMLSVTDNGKGLPPGFDPENTDTLGLKLVRILSRQIKASFEFRNHNGSSFSIFFDENC
ncbi:MAG TPA: histidine kinase dimerization/phosphoacceptor domain -containing protein [Bacteroidales bacterium]|nr:histidine kinase dimerization/phosphoacceptor domain -containing protein [Bacteroidales bacterium]